MSLTVPSLRPEPPIHPFGPRPQVQMLRAVFWEKRGEVRLALAGPPCRLAPARCAWRQMRPPRPRPPPPLSPRSRAGGRSISSPSQEAAVSPFTSAVSGISSVVPGGREGGDVPIPHASLSHRPAWAACCTWLGTKENNRTPDSRPWPGCHGDTSVDVVGGRPEPPPPGPLGGSPLRFPAPVLGSSLPPARGDVRPLPFPSSSDPLLPRVP